MTETRKIRIVVADDHAVLRAGLRMLIHDQNDMEVVGEAADGYEAFQVCSKISPDVILMDVAMPGTGGINAIEKIINAGLRTKILVLTMHDDPAYIRSALAAGATGYVAKRSADSELISAIRSVYRGRIYIDSTHADRKLFIDERSIRKRHDATSKHVLSDREMQVLKMLAHGYTNRQIAEQIFLSVKTVETYRSRLSKKLGLHQRADLVRYAMEMGLLSGDKP